MGEVRTLTLSAMMCAMTVAMLAIGSFLGDLDLTILMLASLCMVFVYVEIGSPYTYLTWLVSSLLTFLFFSGRYFWVVYFFIFGFYPILKGFIERLKRPFWLVLKLVWLNITLVVVFLILSFVLGIDLLEGEAEWMIYVLWGLANVSFLCYDLLIGFLVRMYLVRYREKLVRLFRGH
jgi:hypothetical protein